MTDLDKKTAHATRLNIPINPVNFAQTGYSRGFNTEHNFRNVKLLRDEIDGNVIAIATIPVDANQPDGQLDPIMPVRIISGSNTSNVVGQGNINADGSGVGAITLPTTSFNYWFNGSTWDRARTFNKIASPAAAASPITLNAAGGAGTFFRVFRIMVSLTVAGNLTVSDGTTNWLNAQPVGTTLSTFDYGPQGIVGTGAAAALTATFTGGGNADIIVLYEGPNTAA